MSHFKPKPASFPASRKGTDCHACSLPSTTIMPSNLRRQLMQISVCAQVKWVLQKRGERDASRVHSGGVNAALVTDDGKLAVTLSKDCTARVWDLRSGTCMHVLVGESIVGLPLVSRAAANLNDLCAHGSWLVLLAHHHALWYWIYQDGLIREAGAICLSSWKAKCKCNVLIMSLCAKKGGGFENILRHTMIVVQDTQTAWRRLL